ncbi:MAG: glycosyltransferase [bacterium]|nr:glycosyltransferase [bacterium]
MKISIIIPTMPGREANLRQVIESLFCQTLQRDLYEIIIVWDGKEHPIKFPIKYPTKNRFISYGYNRGLSAARNTGAENANTEISMFLDDDLIPCSKALEIHYQFHQNNPDPMLMAVGNVTWINHPKFNGVMDWFEREGGFSVFSSLKDMAPSPQFLGGFTSFKTEVVRRIRFDESFIAYGCEDHEFGYRFFRLGGKLVFCIEATADHLKNIDAELYYKDHYGAGYSMGNMFSLHPDSTDCADDQLKQVLSLRFKKDSIKQIISTVNSLSMPFCDKNRGLVHKGCLLIDSVAKNSGLRQFWQENYSRYEEAERVLLKSYMDGSVSYAAARQVTELCPTLPHCWFLAGSKTKLPKEKQRCFQRVLDLVPGYAKAMRSYAHVVASNSKDQATFILLSFLEKYEDTFSRNILRKCYLNFGEDFINWGMYENAIKLFQLATEMEPWGAYEYIDSTIAHLRLSIIYSKQQRLKEAEIEIKKAEEKQKEALLFGSKNKSILASIWYAFGSNYKRFNMLDKAKIEFEGLIKFVQEEISFEKFEIIGGVHFHLGCIYQKIGDREKEKNHFKECLRFIPEHVKAKENLEGV